MSDDLDLDAIRGRVANGIYGYLCLNQDVAALLGLAEAKAPDVEQLIERLRAAALDMFHIHDSPSGRQTDRGMAVYLDAAERIIREWASEQPAASILRACRLTEVDLANGAINVEVPAELCPKMRYAPCSLLVDLSPILPPQAAGRQG